MKEAKKKFKYTYVRVGDNILGKDVISPKIYLYVIKGTEHNYTTKGDNSNATI